MTRRIDITGKVVGRLTVLRFSHAKRTASGAGQYFWLCRCECGVEKPVDGCCLRRGSTKSCGCSQATKTHGMTEHPMYVVWIGIKQRCYNPNSDCYEDYGGRGVGMCDAWRDSFAAFYSDMGERPTPLHTIERKNNAGNYEPGNCVWATRAEQNENTRQTRLLTHDGITLSISKWAKRLGVGRTLIRNRLDRLGWPVEKSLTEPPRQRGKGESVSGIGNYRSRGSVTRTTAPV